MQNPVLDRQAKECRELAEAWKKYLEFFQAAVRGGEDINPNSEQTFLEIKSRVAMLHDTFMEALRHDQQVGQNIYQIITRCITMRHVNRMSQAETKKIEIEWHESFLLLNETVSTVQEEIDKLAKINPTKFFIEQCFGTVKVNVVAFLKSRFFKFVVAVSAVLFLVWGVEAFGIYNYDNLRKVKGADKVYIAYLNFKRSALDKSAPFGTLDDFMSRYLPINRPPDGMNYNKDMPKVDKSAAANKFYAYTIEGGVRLADELKNAQAFETVWIDRIGARERGEVYVFWFYSNKEARNLSFGLEKLMATAGGRDFGFSMFNINNVLVAVLSQDKQMRNDIAIRAFRQPAR